MIIHNDVLPMATLQCLDQMCVCRPGSAYFRVLCWVKRDQDAAHVHIQTMSPGMHTFAVLIAERSAIHDAGHLTRVCMSVSSFCIGASVPAGARSEFLRPRKRRPGKKTTSTCEEVGWWAANQDRLRRDWTGARKISFSAEEGQNVALHLASSRLTVVQK